MHEWIVKKTVRNEEGTRTVDILVSKDGKFFRYDENIWTNVEEDDLLFYPDGGYWTCATISGYFVCLDDCERGARSDLKWLSHMS
ncbi:hypothetical protein [Phycobacter sp. K97]|uniref:hypothetical protein n=1 Tax=Phycobacter sedimenti TaxID=3133977 RepID=UPI00311EDB36